MGDKDELFDSHDDQLQQVPELVMDFVDMYIGEENPSPQGQLHEAPVTQDTSQAEDTGAVPSGTPVSDHHNQSLSSTAEGDTNSTDAKESFSETCQAIFGCGPSSLPGSLEGSPSSVSRSLADRPLCVPEPPADNPSILPGLPADNPSILSGPPADNPSILPGPPADNPSILSGPPADNPSILSGPPADNPSILPGPPTGSPLILPGLLTSNPSGVPRSLVDNPSTLLGPQADRPVYVPGSHADNPFYLPGPRAFSPSSHHSSLSDRSSSTFSSSSPASPSWSYGSSSSGCSPVSDVDNSNTNQLDVSNSSQSSSSSSGSEDHVPRYTAGTILCKAVADKQLDWKGQAWNYFEQKFVSPKKEIQDVQPCPAFNQTSSMTAAGVSPDDNYANELKSLSCCKDVRPKETTAVLRISANISYSSPKDSEGLRFVSLEKEPEKRLVHDLHLPVSKRGSDDSLRMETVHEKDNPEPDKKSNIVNKEISSTMTENDEHESPKHHFPQTNVENISRGTRSDQVKDFKRMFPIPRLTRRNKCSPGVFVSPDSVGTRRIKRLSEEFTGSESAIGALCMPSKKMKTDTPAMSRARKRLGKRLK